MEGGKKSGNSHNGKLWTREDVETLLKMRKKNNKYSHIARRLQREVGACRAKYHTLNRNGNGHKNGNGHNGNGNGNGHTGNGNGHKNGHTWTDEDVKLLTQYKIEGLANAEIADKLGRSGKSVRDKWTYVQTQREKDKDYEDFCDEVVDLLGDTGDTVEEDKEKPPSILKLKL